ncbi:MAG: hypothetical protein QXK12_01980 [Candidatus Nezhaarchaeales archaeon]
MQAYDYAFTAAVIIALLLASISIVSRTPQPAINTSEVDQLKMVTQKIMAQLILNPGDPPEWGCNISISKDNLRSIGLAAYTVFTRNAYVLDLDKVQRLSKNLEGLDLYIPPSKMLKLLNLGMEYGIKLRFTPILNVIVTDKGNGVFEVNVASELGLPVADVNVTARIFYEANGEIRGTDSLKNSTYGNGACTLNFGNVQTPALIVVAADYFGVQSVKIQGIGNINKAYFIGDLLILENQTIDSLHQVFVSKYSNGSCFIGNVACKVVEKSRASGYRVYKADFVEPNVVALLAVTNTLVVAYKEVPDSYSSIESGNVYPALSYTLERTVRIGLSTYILKIHVWRASW